MLPSLHPMRAGKTMPFNGQVFKMSFGHRAAAAEFKHKKHYMTEDDHAWLRSFAGGVVSDDEAKALIYARETGAVDNSACRDFCGLDTLAASHVLRRLRDRGLLDKEGSGSTTYYVLNSREYTARAETVQAELPLGIPTSPAEDVGIPQNPHKLDAQSPQVLVGIPAQLLHRIQAAGQKPRQVTVRELLRELCALRPYTAQELAQVLGRKDSRELTRMHLEPMREAGILTLRFPESEKHPHQAYRTVREDKEQDGNA